MFRTVPPSIISSFSLYTQQWYISYSLRAGSGHSVLILLASCQQTCMTYTIAVCTVKTTDDGQRNCPKHVEFYSKNKFEKLVHLVGLFLISSRLATTNVRSVTACRSEGFNCAAAAARNLPSCKSQLFELCPSHNLYMSALNFIAS